MSPLLLENSNITLKQPLGSQGSQIRLEWSSEISQVTWSTPKKSTELKSQAREFQRLQDPDLVTQRILFRKITKGFEEHESILASQEVQIQSLKAQLEAARPRKRKRVRTSPNSKFADIRAIRRAQNEAIRSTEATIEAEASDSSSVSELSLECVMVED